MLLNKLFVPKSHKYEKRRLKLLNQAPKNTALHLFLSTPMPALSTPLDKVEIVAVDFETTGLNAKQDKLLSIGCVNLSGRQIQLASCFHKIITVDQALSPDNVAIHNITDNEIKNGEPLKQVFDQFLTRIAGKVLLVHFNKIEREFFNQACNALYGLTPALPIIDTLYLAQKEFQRQDITFEPQNLTLENLRKQAKLPFYQQHHALSDAIATAELYMSMTNSTQTNMQLKDVLI